MTSRSLDHRRRQFRVDVEDRNGRANGGCGETGSPVADLCLCAIDLPDNAVDSIFCMCMMHHIGDSPHRLAILRKFQRVTRYSVITSLWVDANLNAWKRKRVEVRRRDRGERDGYQNRFVLPAASVEAEFEKAGFRVRKSLDLIPL